MEFIEESQRYLPMLLRGVELTLEVSLGALLLSTALGIVLAMMRISGSPWIYHPAKWTVAVTRGLPAMVQVYYVYFVLPDYGIALTAFAAAVIGLGVANAGFQAENFRAGIEAVDSGQAEAADSLGMKWHVKMQRVIVPQAIKVMLPTYGNSMVSVLKDSSLASTITVAELSLQGKLLAASTFENTTVFTLVALLYLCMCIPLMAFNRWLEHRTS
ncbi:amino acid ABC transporter permease [Caballeronia sp. DA-9]|uniref:amino acid ABC transporter permease n=1 Tax=Caballeronia sp. DA-9 TaxID=3436237 RepID=UPI003F661930